MNQELQPIGSSLPVPMEARSPLPKPAEQPPLRRELRGPARLGLLITLLFFGIGGGWAATAPISGAVIAAGVVSPQGSRQRVQHLEGGIIREIRVREGDRVQSGDVLLVLEDVSARAEVGQLLTRLRALAATEARLDAERRGVATVDFGHPSLADTKNPEVRDVIEQQVNQLATRRANDESRTAVLTQRIAQLQQQIVGAQRQLESVRRQNALIGEEVVTVRELFEKGYEKKPRLLELQRKEAELLGDDGELVSRVARAEEQIGETKLQIMNVRVQRMEDIDKELSETQARRIEVEQQIRQSLDRLARTAIVAPVAGTILDLAFKTTGGVVRPGEQVLDIVPEKDELVVDARIRPQDIDDVHAGLHAYVMFPSFPQRNLHRVEAKVRSVSADAFEEERTGERYFTAKVQVDRQQLHELDPEIQLSPGMPAEVFITTVDRTLLEYIGQPLVQTVERSLREQ